MLRANNLNLQSLIDQANALPDAGGSSDSEMINVSVDKFSLAPVFYLDNSDMIKSGEIGTEIQTLHGIVMYYGGYSMGPTGIYSASENGLMKVVKFKADGGSVCVKRSGGDDD